MASMVYPIHRNAPPPPSPKGGSGRPATYPFAELQVGQAFDAPIALRRTISACATQWGKRLNARFTTRKIDAATVRVWRVA